MLSRVKISRNVAATHCVGHSWSVPVSALFLCCAWAYLPACAEPGAEGSQDSRQALHACVDNLAVTDHASFKVTVDLTDHRPDGLVPQEIETVVRRQGGLIDYAGSYRFPESPDNSFRFRNVVNSERFIGYQVKPKLEQELDRAPEGGFTADDREQHSRRVVQWPQHGAFLDGYADWAGELRVPQLLLNSPGPLTVTREDLNGVPSIVVRGTTDYGTVTCWLSADGHHALQAFRLQKRAGDLLGRHASGRDMRIGRPAESDGPEYPAACELQLQNVAHQQVDGRPVCVRGELVFAIEHMDGTHTRRTYSAKRTDIQLTPDFAGTDAFQIDLANGTPMTHWDHLESGVRYEWQDGEVRLSGAHFAAAASPTYSKSRAGVFVLLANAAVFLLFGGWVWWRSWQRSA